MAEDEVHEADLEFENTDAGASLTHPSEAGKVRKGGHLVIRGRPCKVRPSGAAPALLLALRAVRAPNACEVVSLRCRRVAQRVGRSARPQGACAAVQTASGCMECSPRM